jgi:hypothetical protein
MGGTGDSGLLRESLAACEGFGVYGPSARIVGSWLVHVPVDEVADVVPDERRILLRPGGLLAGPRRAEADTRAA